MKENDPDNFSFSYYIIYRLPAVFIKTCVFLIWKRTDVMFLKFKQIPLFPMNINSLINICYFRHLRISEIRQLFPTGIVAVANCLHFYPLWRFTPHRRGGKAETRYAATAAVVDYSVYRGQIQRVRWLPPPPMSKRNQGSSGRFMYNVSSVHIRVCVSC